ncbi:MAG: UDP-3-O-[3-hydroxymyristoyl] N-acetylglucosamine deacetylase [Rhodospirillaceae bacterium]|nr:MAG: UDP-3-O-[3-hydroxymyristoyl] N-acetylglucosamine deacetylase [Rhodospirillaceae bacterium]
MSSQESETSVGKKLDKPVMTIKQKTLKSAISCTGIGLHSGEKVTMTLLPADIDAGITFRRTDVAGEGAEIKAAYDNVCDTRLCTTIGSETGKTIGTVEHLMAALSGAGIDNVTVEVGGAEVPIMDGSAAPFLFLIDCAGVVEQDAPRKVIRILKTVSITQDDKTATLTAADGFALDFAIDFASPVIASQDFSVGLNDGVFKDEIARARTFGFMHEVEALWAAGLAKGGSLDNAVVISGDKIMNEEGLRFDDEFVRHKILDAVGDLYLAGNPIQGHYSGVRSGHALNNQLLNVLFSDSSNYEIVHMIDDSSRMASQNTGAGALNKATVAASPATA